ncbi:secreted salivary gland peptide, putative [Ixodes scapularis]|uniref:Secreted salivary gland peptide, putative n=1 Tax=Ixodes scapularis TaxID=6945 RepID=B7QBY3_IXOSC|nr:secreted salivary gland peptide, putative [Ixodes scapularis]|eukprot:XP_002413047.1 secreted salivary gland peptide, putative [Ixodes scapularis]
MRSWHLLSLLYLGSAWSLAEPLGMHLSNWLLLRLRRKLMRTDVSRVRLAVNTGANFEGGRVLLHTPDRTFVSSHF